MAPLKLVSGMCHVLLPDLQVDLAVLQVHAPWRLSWSAVSSLTLLSELPTVVEGFLYWLASNVVSNHRAGAEDEECSPASYPLVKQVPNRVPTLHSGESQWWKSFTARPEQVRQQRGRPRLTISSLWVTINSHKNRKYFICSGACNKLVLIRQVHLLSGGRGVQQEGQSPARLLEQGRQHGAPQQGQLLRLLPEDARGCQGRPIVACLTPTALCNSPITPCPVTHQFI